MRYYVRTGDLDCSTDAKDHLEAALKSVMGSEKSFGAVVIVNEREIDEEDHAGNRYFLTQSILDGSSMRLVG